MGVVKTAKAQVEVVTGRVAEEAVNRAAAGRQAEVGGPAEPRSPEVALHVNSHQRAYRVRSLARRAANSAHKCTPAEHR